MALVRKAHSGSNPAMTSTMVPGKILPLLLNILRARRRLFFSALIGLAAITALPSGWEPVTRALLGWDIGVAIYLAVAFWNMRNADAEGIRRRAASEDEGKLIILALTVAAALASIGAIVIELKRSPGQPCHPCRAAAGHCHHPVVMGLHADDLRYALCARILR